MTKKAAIYVRVSTDEQSKSGFSVGEQKETGKAYAKQKGYKLIGTYTDDGVSGSKGLFDREGLLELYEAKPDVLICRDSSRLMRADLQSDAIMIPRLLEDQKSPLNSQTA